jgi:hypothetical protein
VTAPATGQAAYEAWRAAVPDYVCNVPAGPWEDLPKTIRAGFDAIAAQQPEPGPGTGADVKVLAEVYWGSFTADREWTAPYGALSPDYRAEVERGIGAVVSALHPAPEQLECMASPRCRPLRPQPAPELAQLSQYRAALLKIRSALQDNPTASGARREGLETVNSLDLDGLLDSPDAQAAPDVRSREGERGFYDVTCGNCGGEHGTNFAVDQIECPHCEARRCPHCGGWFGGEDD